MTVHRRNPIFPPLLSILSLHAHPSLSPRHPPPCRLMKGPCPRVRRRPRRDRGVLRQRSPTDDVFAHFRALPPRQSPPRCPERPLPGCSSCEPAGDDRLPWPELARLAELARLVASISESHQRRIGRLGSLPGPALPRSVIWPALLTSSWKKETTWHGLRITSCLPSAMNFAHHSHHLPGR